MLRLLLALALVTVTENIRADDLPAVASIASSISRSGDKVAGSISACVVCVGDRPLAAFGLKKQLDAKAEYTFFIVFKTGGKKFEGIGSSSELSADGKTVKRKSVLEIGDFELPVFTEETLGPGGESTVTKFEIAGHVITENRPRVLVADFSQDRPTYTALRVELPTSVPDLGDEEHQTWPKALLEAVSQLKMRSPELKSRIE